MGPFFCNSASNRPYNNQCNGAPWPFHWEKCILSRVPGAYQWIHISSTVTTKCMNSLGLRLNNINHCCEAVLRLRFLSIVSKRGTHCIAGSLIHNISSRIWSTRSFEIPAVSATSHTFNWGSSKTRSGTFVTLSYVAAIFGARSKSSKDRFSFSIFL